MYKRQGRYLEEKYSYSKVTLEKPSHDTTNIADGDSYPIQATVTFIGFNDQTIHTQEVSWSGSDTTKVVQLPENLKAKAVKVEYFSEELKQATGNQYVLGQNFEPGTIDIPVSYTHLDVYKRQDYASKSNYID